MVSVSVNGLQRRLWPDQYLKLARRVAMHVLDGCGIPSTDVEDIESSQIMIVVRRQCTDAERRKVVEKYLQA